jgi:hypothetical protein
MLICIRILYGSESGISYMLVPVWLGESIVRMGLSYGGLSLIGRGAVIVLTDRICINGWIRCVDACTPLVLLFPLPFCCVLFLCLIQDISGLLYMFCRVESPSGSFLRWMG